MRTVPSATVPSRPGRRVRYALALALLLDRSALALPAHCEHTKTATEEVTVCGYKKQREGVYILFGGDGSKRRECHYAGGQLQGLCTRYYDGGKPLDEVTYDKGIEAGPFKRYHKTGKVALAGSTTKAGFDGKLTGSYPDGTRRVIARFHDGVPGGDWEFFGPNGRRRIKVTYKDGHATAREPKASPKDHDLRLTVKVSGAHFRASTRIEPDGKVVRTDLAQQTHAEAYLDEKTMARLYKLAKVATKNLVTRHADDLVGDGGLAEWAIAVDGNEPVTASAREGEAPGLDALAKALADEVEGDDFTGSRLLGLAVTPD